VVTLSVEDGGSIGEIVVIGEVQANGEGAIAARIAPGTVPAAGLRMSAPKGSITP
jgi:hypothetical protein